MEIDNTISKWQSASRLLVSEDALMGVNIFRFRGLSKKKLTF